MWEFEEYRVLGVTLINVIQWPRKRWYLWLKPTSDRGLIGLRTWASRWDRRQEEYVNCDKSRQVVVDDWVQTVIKDMYSRVVMKKFRQLFISVRKKK